MRSLPEKRPQQGNGLPSNIRPVPKECPDEPKEIGRRFAKVSIVGRANFQSETSCRRVKS